MAAIVDPFDQPKKSTIVDPFDTAASKIVDPFKPKPTEAKAAPPSITAGPTLPSDLVFRQAPPEKSLIGKTIDVAGAALALPLEVPFAAGKGIAQLGQMLYQGKIKDAIESTAKSLIPGSAVYEKAYEQQTPLEALGKEGRGNPLVEAFKQDAPGTMLSLIPFLGLAKLRPVVAERPVMTVMEAGKEAELNKAAEQVQNQRAQNFEEQSKSVESEYNKVKAQAGSSQNLVATRSDIVNKTFALEQMKAEWQKNPTEKLNKDMTAIQSDIESLRKKLSPSTDELKSVLDLVKETHAKNYPINNPMVKSTPKVDSIYDLYNIPYSPELARNAIDKMMKKDAPTPDSTPTERTVSNSIPVPAKDLTMLADPKPNTFLKIISEQLNPSLDVIGDFRTMKADQAIVDVVTALHGDKTADMKIYFDRMDKIMDGLSDADRERVTYEMANPGKYPAHTPEIKSSANAMTQLMKEIADHDVKTGFLKPEDVRTHYYMGMYKNLETGKVARPEDIFNAFGNSKRRQAIGSPYNKSALEKTITSPEQAMAIFKDTAVTPIFDPILWGRSRVMRSINAIHNKAAYDKIVALAETRPDLVSKTPKQGYIPLTNTPVHVRAQELRFLQDEATFKQSINWLDKTANVVKGLGVGLTPFGAPHWLNAATSAYLRLVSPIKDMGTIRNQAYALRMAPLAAAKVVGALYRSIVKKWSPEDHAAYIQGIREGWVAPHGILGELTVDPLNATKFTKFAEGFKKLLKFNHNFLFAEGRVDPQFRVMLYNTLKDWNPNYAPAQMRKFVNQTLGQYNPRLMSAGERTTARRLVEFWGWESSTLPRILGTLKHTPMAFAAPLTIANFVNYLNSDKMMWDNDSGHKFDIMVGRDKEGHPIYMGLPGVWKTAFNVTGASKAVESYQAWRGGQDALNAAKDYLANLPSHLGQESWRRLFSHYTGLIELIANNKMHFTQMGKSKMAMSQMIFNPQDSVPQIMTDFAQSQAEKIVFPFKNIEDYASGQKEGPLSLLGFLGVYANPYISPEERKAKRDIMKSLK